MVSGRPAEPDLLTALQAAGFGEWIESGRLVVLPAGEAMADRVTVLRDALAVILNYAHHTYRTGTQDPQLGQALSALNEEMSK